MKQIDKVNLLVAKAICRNQFTFVIGMSILWLLLTKADRVKMRSYFERREFTHH